MRLPFALAAALLLAAPAAAAEGEAATPAPRSVEREVGVPRFPYDPEARREAARACVLACSAGRRACEGAGTAPTRACEADFLLCARACSGGPLPGQGSEPARGPRAPLQERTPQ